MKRRRTRFVSGWLLFGARSQARSGTWEGRVVHEIEWRELERESPTARTRESV